MNIFQQCRLFFMKVDPFAVEQAERQLDAAGRSIPRQQLINHYLICGRLDTLVERYLSEATSNDHDATAQAVAADLVANTLQKKSSYDPKFVAPLKLGMLLSALAIAVIVMESLIVLIRQAAQAKITSFTYEIEVAVLVLVLAACFSYAYLGAKWGRQKATNVVGGVLLVILIAVVVSVAKYLGRL